MKKFLIFLVSIVVVVCVSLTTYYFMRNNEIITVKTKEIYCNAGDTIPLKSLGISIEKANISKKTVFDYNAGGEDVTKFIKYDEASDSFIVSQENAGDVTLVIRTTNKKYADFTINVHIGNGSVENPYYIFNESELMRIGANYRLDKNYLLMNNITLTSNFTPIGYNSSTSTWDGFNGTFDGQGNVIKGLNLNQIETEKVGFFSSLGRNSVVKNLTIENASISGDYQNAGILAGTIDGSVEKIQIKNSNITNNTSGNVGALAGVYAGNSLRLSYADNVALNVGTEENQTTNTIGGLVGKLNKATIQACYTNNVNINTTNSISVAGGLVGEMVIGTETGSIQQSYANTTSMDTNFGAFVGKVTKSSEFDSSKAIMLKHLIGNIAVVYGKESQADILDTDLVKSFDSEYFKKVDENDKSVFYEANNALYLVRGFISSGEVISTNEFVYYAIDMNTITNWDTTYVWNVENNSLPTLRMGSIYPADPSGEYFRRNFEQKDMGNKEVFTSTFSSDVENKNVKVLNDIDLSNGWTPVAIKNTTIDGNNKTITINLNNASNEQLGLFTRIDNSTIKNLNIVVTGVSANATNAGALAGIITSTDAMSNSSIENVKITYQGFATPVITNFGGLAGTIEKTNILNCEINGLSINIESQVKNAGAFAGTVNNSQIKDCKIANTTIVGTTNIGGVAGINNGTITNVSGSVNVVSNTANVGGVVATNNGVIDNVELTVDLIAKNTKIYQNIGGVAGTNAGSISNVTINGNKISIDVNNGNIIYVGGVVATNNGTISNVVNNIKEVGTYYVNANHYVGGVVATNNGTIKKVVTQSNLNGNYVAGVVEQMNNSKAIIDQVMVGKFDSASRILFENQIKADKYIAGVVVDFKNGKITNVQASSKLNGQTNSTRSSLVALVFEYGTTLKNATINSSFSGYGTRYREVWTDFASFDNKAEFGLANLQSGIDGRYNIYLQDVHHGIMQSVVINGSKEGVSGSKASLGSAFAWGKDYQDTDESSYVKIVDGFSTVSQFQGSFEFVCAKSSVFGFEHKATKTLTFSIGDIWKSNNGISLMFVDDLI